MRTIQRRDFVYGGLLAAATSLIACRGVPLPVGQSDRMHRIGYLGPGSLATNAPQRDAFRRSLRELGYVDGQNVAVELRYADGDESRLPDLAAELSRLDVDVILTSGTAGIRAAGQASTVIPIVFATAGPD